MDVYKYKNDVVEVCFEASDFPLAFDAFKAGHDQIREQHKAYSDRVKPIINKPWGGIAAVFMIPRVLRYTSEVDVLEQAMEDLRGGEWRMQGLESGYVLNVITLGMTILAREREEPLTDMLATIHYHQIPKM